MRARDVMVSPVITADESATVRDVAKLMLEKHISAVPVVDRAGKLVGIVSEADLMRRQEAGTEQHSSWWLSLLLGERALAADYIRSHATKVTDIMARDIHAARPDTPLCEIADIFEEKHIKRVPIVNDNNVPVGIVSRANILQAIASARPKLDISAPDTIIREQLFTELKKHSWSRVRRLNATVSNGVVDLWGFADSDVERKAIRVAAESIPGVTLVNDHLKEATEYLY